MSPAPRVILFALACELLLFGFLGLALLDRRAHQADTTYGINQWGYRDEARGAKEANEIRVALVGGSGAFEPHLPAAQTLAGRLIIELRAVGARKHVVFSVVNLSQPQAGADTYVETLRDYEYLRPDVVVVFDGYDTLTGRPRFGRRHSNVYRATGYLPLLPSKLLHLPAWLSDADDGLAPLLRDETGSTLDVGCEGASAAHCAAMVETVRFAIARGHDILVASPPFLSSKHEQQQRSLARHLQSSLKGMRGFLYLDLGHALPLADRVQSPDGMHRSEIGNHAVAQRIAASLESFLGTTASLSYRAGGS